MYQEMVHAQLERWNAKIEELRSQAEQAEEGTSIEYDEIIESLSRKRDQLEQSLDALEQAGEESWEEFKLSTDNILESMEDELSGITSTAGNAGEQLAGWDEEAAELVVPADRLEEPEEEMAVTVVGPEEPAHKVSKREDIHLGDNLIGKSIISISDGRIVGPVKELYLDRNLERVTAIIIGDGGFWGLGEGGLFSRKVGVVRREDIVLFGIDTILIKESRAAKRTDHVPELSDWISRTRLKGRAIDTPGGTKIGILGDIVFDNEGRIVGFKLSQALVEGPIARKRAITRDVVVDTGNEDGIMTIDLAKAEQQEELIAAHLA